MINNRDKEVLKAFGAHLRSIRESKSISQQHLALKADISKNQIGNIERGEVNSTVISITAIAKALDIHPKELFNF
ncbi:helix-turn-helix domain-containing protein [Daejeonella rubra]|uniref:helix-turn-helix domain-containing protein n=1 Tax=Daejeonella rubra TaxID=990371 RepID=UPI001C885C2C|nr:helix-turn-helix transcriptional regulator [Daejeonella rubra]